MESTSCSVRPQRTSAWPVAGLLLDAVSTRNFDAMPALFDEQIRFRALVPPGPFELNSPVAVAEKFRSWFGGADDFEVLDASVGEIGSKIYARWRIRMNPPGDPEQARIVEQHVFTTGAERIATVELLCSGFMGESR